MFPKDDAMKLKWKIAIRRMDPVTKRLWEPGNTAVVCRRHFTRDSYVETLLGESFLELNIFMSCSSEKKVFTNIDLMQMALSEAS